MSFERARSLQAVYDDVADHDLVVVPDNPLADAINRRVETPTFGTFATTPRRLARGRREAAEDRTAFLEVVERTELDWKRAAYAVGNVLQCWEHEGDRDAVLAYDAYADAPTAAVVDVLADCATTSGQLSEYAIASDRSVAVVGEDQLTTLERLILPADYDSVPLFAGEAADLPPFHVFDAAADIVDAVLDTVSAETADDVAVVLDGASKYSSLVEAALAAADVPYYGGPGFADDPDHRCFLRLLRACFRGSETTVADVRPLCARLGVDLPVDHDDKRVDAVDLPATRWLVDFRDAVDARTFAEALAAYERQCGRSLEGFHAELDRLGLADEPVTRGRVEDLAYYLQTYDVPVDRENAGVLLADAKSAGYVDRPVVFYLGMGEGWTHSAPDRPWVDADAQFDRYLRRFQLLLQSGTEQYYLVQDAAGGQPVTPCLYFGELLDASFERFSDLASVVHDRPDAADASGFERESMDLEADSLSTISQSSLNTYVNCPREYYFDRLLESPDRDYFREGRLFHDFAELCVNHPEFVDDATVAEAVDVMLAETAAFFHDDERGLRRRKYRVGLETIREYLAENLPADEDFLTPASGWPSNHFAEYFDRPVDSPLTERWFENPAIGAKGMIDLVRAPGHIVDHKSGYKKSAATVVRDAGVDPVAETPDFQAAMYLSHMRSQRPGEPIEFTFFHFLETMDDVIAGEADLADTLTTVHYRPERFAEYVGTAAAYGELVDGYNDCVATFEDLGPERYREVLAPLEWPTTTEREALLDSEFAAAFTNAVVAETSDAVDAEKGCEQAMRALNGVRKRTFFEEDLDAFESFLDERLAEVNRRRAGDERFPIDGPGGEPNYRRVDHRDLLLEGER